MPAMRPAVLYALLLVAGCGSKQLEPEYTGCGTDEHWQTFDDNEPMATVATMSGPALLQPTPGSTVSSSTKPILTWNQDPNDPGMNTGDVIYMNGPGCNMCCPQFSRGALATLHEPPISGDVYDLQFRINGNLVWRVITTLQEWTPTDDFWAQMKGKTIALKIYRMTILVNELKQGPYVAPAPFTFTVAN
jgi:hypothetical protein